MKQSHTRKAWLWLNGLSVSKLLSKADTKLKWHFHPPMGQSAIMNIQNMHIIIAATFRFQSHLLAFTSQQRYIWFHLCPQNMYPLQFRPSTYHPVDSNQFSNNNNVRERGEVEKQNKKQNHASLNAIDPIAPAASVAPDSRYFLQLCHSVSQEIFLPICAQFVSPPVIHHDRHTIELFPPQLNPNNEVWDLPI